MAKLINLTNLTKYDELIKNYIDTADAASIKAVTYDASTRVVSFFKVTDTTTTPYLTITLPDTSNFIEKIANATAGDFVTVTATGDLVDAGDSIDADKIDYDNTTSGLAATDAQAAIDELASQSAGGVASKTVYITETAGQSADPYSKRYGIYQGATGSSASPVVGEKLADIDIPKDMVVEDGAVVDVVFVAADNSLHEGSASGTDVTAEIKGSATATADDAGKYIKLTIANAASSHLWIKATDLVDIYTTEQSATQVQLAIDNNNVISATIVAGSVTATELASDAVTTAKILDANVTKAKLAQGVQDSLDLADSAVQSVTASDPTTGTDGTITVDGTEVAVKGLGSAAYTASSAYDPAGTGAAEAAAAVAALDATETQTAGADGLSLSITETDGVITAISGSIASGTYLDTATYTMAEESDITGLFS